MVVECVHTRMTELSTMISDLCCICEEGHGASQQKKKKRISLMLTVYLEVLIL